MATMSVSGDMSATCRRHIQLSCFLPLVVPFFAMSEDNFFSEFARVTTVLEDEDTPSLVSGTYSTPRGDDGGVVDMFGTSVD